MNVYYFAIPHLICLINILVCCLTVYNLVSKQYRYYFFSWCMELISAVDQIMDYIFKISN